MKQLIIIIAALLLLPLSAIAQYEEDTENGVVSLNGKEGFTIATKKGDFVFKPYMLVQTSANINYYDDEGLDPAYNQDNIHNSGFSIPYAILGFTGKAFNRVTFNLSINAAGSGGNILQQAWFDVEMKKSREPKKEYSLSVMKTTHGILRTRDQKCGSYTIHVLTRVKA